MASITIIRGLNQQGVALTSPLVSVYIPTGIEFDFDRDALAGTYAEVSVGSYVFKAVKVSSAGSVDRYQIAVDWLQYLTSLPTLVANITVSSITYTITGRNSSGVSVATANATIQLSHGCPSFGSARGLYDVWNVGYNQQIYHAGKYSLFNKNNGTYEIGTSTAIGIYKAMAGEEIAWINADGGWSFWNFKKQSKNFESKASNFVPTFNLYNYQSASAGRNLTREKSVQIDFKTVAINAEHHEQLCYLSSSPLIIYDGKEYQHKKTTETTGAEKQNLAFTLTLESKENAASN